MNEYDLIILGSGPGGYVAALYAAQHGLRVCVVEKDKIGGVCLNTGCIPTKTFLASAKLLSEIKDSEKMGIKVKGYSFDTALINKRKNDVVNRLRQGIESLLKARKVDVIAGSGRLADKNTVSVGSKTLKAKYIIIATGSRPAELPVLKFDGENIVSSDEMLELQDKPARIAVIGGGAIGCEFAGIFSEFGNEVAIIEMMERLMPASDTEIAMRLEAALKRKGINVFTGTRVKSHRSGDKGGLVLEAEGAANTIACDRALVCIGRTPNIEEIGLDKAGIASSPNGIKVNKELRTSAENIYAIGDAIGGYMYAHVASYEGILACDNIMGKRREADYGAVPSCVFTNPDISSVGINEDQAKEGSLSYDVARFHFRSLGKAHALGKTEGMIKIVVGKPGNKVIGVDIIGESASDLIAEAALAVKMKATLEDLAHTIHAHPTMAEIILEASHAGLKKPIHSL